MQSHTNFSAFIIFLTLTAMIASGAGPETDEKALWNLWRTHLSASNNHESVIASFQQISQNAPSNSLFVVARGLCAWHLLQASKTNEAVDLLEAMLTADSRPATVNSLNSACAEMGRRWLTRIDREKVREALRAYYRREIAYPANLEYLKKIPRVTVPPLTDRWNVRWIYRQTGFQTIKGLDNQRYLLQSAQLGETSDLKIALARPYACAINLKPVSVTTTASGVQNVRFETNATNDRKTGIILMAEGTRLENITLVYVGVKIIILSDGDYWMITPKP